MSLGSEQLAKRKGTLAFIKANPVQLTLIPQAKVKTASGGSLIADGQPRVAQMLRLIEAPSAYGNQPGRLRTGDGEQEKIDFQLLGMWDAQIDVGDHWTDDNGVQYKVVELLPFNGYERRGRVTKYGN